MKLIQFFDIELRNSRYVHFLPGLKKSPAKFSLSKNSPLHPLPPKKNKKRQEKKEKAQVAKFKSKKGLCNSPSIIETWVPNLGGYTWSRLIKTRQVQ